VSYKFLDFDENLFILLIIILIMPKIKVDKKKCIGCGSCASICDNFVMQDGKAKVVKASVVEITCEKQAEKSCPVGAIKVEG